MRKHEELHVGQRFGKLTYLGWDETRKFDNCKCICDCGKIKYARTGRLLNGTTTSCGCGLIKPQNDLSEQRFGKLLVLRQYRINKYKGYDWLCKCDCGTEKWVRGSQLTNGNTNSCGCAQYQNVIRPKKMNKYEIKDNLVEVKLSNSDAIMICDVDDWENLKQYTWGLSNSGYAYSKVDIKSKEINLLFHTMVKPLQDDGKVIDHINENKLDNRKENLRYVTPHANSVNKSKPNKNNQSGYRGVCFSKTMNKWQARITINSKGIVLGYFDTKEEAYKVRKEAEEIYFLPLFD